MTFQARIFYCLTCGGTDKNPLEGYMITQLNPTILVETPLGRGHAIFIIDYGIHQNTCWVVANQETGQVKHFDCNDIILSTNYTYGMNLRHHTNVRKKPESDEKS